MTNRAAVTSTEEPSSGSEEVSTGAFRAACAQYATGMTVVTTSTPEGDFGVTVNAFTSLSLEPPQVIVCLARDSKTLAAVERSQVFAVNVLAADQVPLARLFATKRPDKFNSGVHFQHGAVGPPLLDGTLATLECRLVDAFPSGTHVILIGRAVRVAHDPANGPALFFRSRMYAALVEDAATPTTGDQ